MILRKYKTHKAQALLEVTMLASILLFLLSVIVRTGSMSNERQKFFMESFKDAIHRASNDTVQHNTLNFQGDYFRNVRVPDVASHSGVQNLEQMKAAWHVKRTDRLNYAAGTNYESMNRKHFVVDGASGMKELENPEAIQNPTETGLMTGFTTEGFKEGFKLPTYEVPVPYDWATSNPTAEMYCFRYKMPDPEDIYPADGIFWSWVAICAKQWKFTQQAYEFVPPDTEYMNVLVTTTANWSLGNYVSYTPELNPGEDSGIPFFHANCERCDEDDDEDRIYSAYVADTQLDDNGKPGGKTCHPAASADSLKGVRFYGEDDLLFEYYMYFQSAYDPSVPLNKNFMAYMHCYDSANSVAGDHRFSVCNWTQDQLKTGEWIMFAYRTLEHGQSLHLLSGAHSNAPFISRGKQIWLSFDDLKDMLPDSGSGIEELSSAMLNNVKFQKAVAYTDTVQYVNCGATVKQTSDSVTVESNWNKTHDYGCGGTFAVASLRSSQCNAKDWKLSTGEDSEVQFWFGAIDGLDLKHSVWGDIDMNAASSRIQDQGIKGYRLKSSVDIKVETSGTGGGKIETSTDVSVKDTIVRQLKTNPFGRLLGTDYDITQERKVDGTMYEYEVE